MTINLNEFSRLEYLNGNLPPLMRWKPRNVILAWVWGDAESSDPSGFFLKFKAGFPGAHHTHTGSYNWIVLQGRYMNWEISDEEISALSIGSPFWQAGDAAHDDAVELGQGCISYFRIDGQFEYFPHAK